MKNMKMVTCVLATGLMVFSTTAPTFAEKQTNIQETIHTKEQEKKDALKQLDDSVKQLKELDRMVQENEQKLKDTNASITETQKQIQQKQMAINELQKKIEYRAEVIKKRVSAMQTQQSVNMVTEVVVNAKSMAELVDRMTSVNTILQSDKRILDEQDRDQKKVKAEREEVVKKDEQLRAFMKALESTQQKIIADRKEKQTVADALDQKVQQLASEINTMTKAEQKRMEASAMAVQSASVGELDKAVKTTKPVMTPAANGSIIGRAQQYLGVPYVFGGASPSGFDCSGFISYVFGVGRQDAAGFYNSATKISEPQPGDLVFFANTYKPGISHIGIYVGNGTMIHASDSGIAYGSLNSSYNRAHFAGYGRL